MYIDASGIVHRHKNGILTGRTYKILFFAAALFVAIFTSVCHAMEIANCHTQVDLPEGFSCKNEGSGSAQGFYCAKKKQLEKSDSKVAPIVASYEKVNTERTATEMLKVLSAKVEGKPIYASEKTIQGRKWAVLIFCKGKECETYLGTNLKATDVYYVFRNKNVSRSWKNHPMKKTIETIKAFSNASHCHSE